MGMMRLMAGLQRPTGRGAGDKSVPFAWSVRIGGFARELRQELALGADAQESNGDSVAVPSAPARIFGKTQNV
jgi:hypothetical protein